MTSFLVDDAGVPTAHDVLRRLIDVLIAADFARTDRIPLPGGPLDLLLDPVNTFRGVRGQSNLLHPSAVPGLHRGLLHRRRPAAVALQRLLTAGETRPVAEIEELLGPTLLHHLQELGALSDTGRADTGRGNTGRGIRSEILVVPYRGRIYLSDALRNSGVPDFCYLGRASFAGTDLALDELAQLPANGSRRVLDLGCGPAVAGLALSDSAAEVVVSDIAPRAVRFARLNALLNGIDNAVAVVSDICSDVEGSFDVVITHPPGGWTGGSAGSAVVAAAGGQDFGLELPQRMIRAALERTRPGGTVYAVIFAPVLGDRPYAVDVLRRICVDLPAEAVLHPYLDYYEYADTTRYREHGVTSMVRYLVRLRPAAEFSVRFATLDRPRWLSSRLRTAPARVAGAVKHR